MEGRMLILRGTVKAHDGPALKRASCALLQLLVGGVHNLREPCVVSNRVTLGVADADGGYLYARGITKTRTAIAVPRSQLVCTRQRINLKGCVSTPQLFKIVRHGSEDRRIVHAVVWLCPYRFSGQQVHAYIQSNPHWHSVSPASPDGTATGMTQQHSIGHHWSYSRYAVGCRNVAEAQHSFRDSTRCHTEPPISSLPPLRPRTQMYLNMRLRLPVYTIHCRFDHAGRHFSVRRTRSRWGSAWPVRIKTHGTCTIVLYRQVQGHLREDRRLHIFCVPSVLPR